METAIVQTVSAKPIKIQAAGNWTLHGTKFQPTQAAGNGPAILISAAAGVPHGYYSNFAQYLIANGAAAVVSYDYRGMASSAGERSRWPELRMKHWALYDFPAAIDYLEALAPNSELVGIGHSYGGQALGLYEEANRFARYCSVATMSGYWKDLDTPYSVWLQTQMFSRIVVALLGYVPKKLSVGERFPGTIMTDWANWIAKPDYFFSDPDLPQTANFAKAILPFLSIGLTDDPWGNEKAMGKFMAQYRNADLHQHWISPGASGPIGHLGLFRQRHADLHWPVLRDFLLKGQLPVFENHSP